ncbi:MAG: V-type ATP synthase subunit K [Thermodesulfobacteriota bacterium]|nr:V-type ATP synthase subunit K [Thermodesulfobacteriota bacterium]
MTIVEILGDTGFVLALCLAALGSALGTSAAGMSALGAWKKCFMTNKNAPFILVAFVGAPLSQTIYGMILMNAIKGSPETVSALTRFVAGLLGGFTMGISAWFQGKAGALASDVLAEFGKGFGNYMMVIGIIETVALFVMVFLMTVLR